MRRTSKPARVIVFAKAPRVGAVKTRLIPLLGAHGAAALHARLLEHTLAMAESAHLGALELHGAPADDEFLRACAARFGASLIEQAPGDLGTRMHLALEGALRTSRAVVLVGSDCPAMTARHLRAAASALADGHDAVFAPTEDGGYALVGLARADPHLFERITWASQGVMDETRRRVRELGWSAVELETLWDVDRPEDHARLMASGLIVR